MKKLFASIVCCSLAALVAVSAGEKGTAKIEGRWVATGAISDGKKVPQEEVDKLMLTVTIKEGKYSVGIGAKVVEAGTYKVDASKKPIQLDLTIGDGKDKGKVQLGIAQMEGDKLTIALGNAGSTERPKTFEGAAGVEVTHLKRSK